MLRHLAIALYEPSPGLGVVSILECVKVAPEVAVDEDRAVQVEPWAAQSKHPSVSVCVVDGFVWLASGPPSVPAS